MAQEEQEQPEAGRRTFMKSVVSASLLGAAAVVASEREASAQECGDQVIDGLMPRAQKASVQLTFSGQPTLREIQVELQRVFEWYKCLRCGFGGLDLDIRTNPVLPAGQAGGFVVVAGF